MIFKWLIYVVSVWCMSVDGFSGELQESHIDKIQAGNPHHSVPAVASELSSLKEIYAHLLERRNNLLIQARSRQSSKRERFMELRDSFEKTVNEPIRFTAARVNIDSALVRIRSDFVLRESPSYESMRGESIRRGAVMLHIADVRAADGDTWVLLWSGNEAGFAVSSYVTPIPFE